jgi:mono/diheme cytochrome c family protein
MRASMRTVVCAGSILLCLKAGLVSGQFPAPAAEGVQHSAPLLVFDAETKRYDAMPAEEVAPFVFNLTNVWTNEIVIKSVRASCGCTTASMPPVPWHIPPGGAGQVHAQVNLAGKMGLLTKTLTFDTSVGDRIAYLTVNIPLPPASGGKLSQSERRAAMARATADARAIFQGDCAKCHVEKGRDAMGESLYAADCGICHESSHRESIVPDLHALKVPTDLDYWRAVITLGKPHSLMPGFSAAHGGPLSDQQIESLARYLDHTISHHLSSKSPAADFTNKIANRETR